MRVRRLTRELIVLLPEDLEKALELAAREKNIGKSTLARMILTEHLSPYLKRVRGEGG
jgi:hypothetical protein